MLVTPSFDGNHSCGSDPDDNDNCINTGGNKCKHKMDEGKDKDMGDDEVIEEERKSAEDEEAEDKVMEEGRLLRLDKKVSLS